MSTSEYALKCFPILPIGKVNLQTGKNAMFGTVWDCWKDGTSLVVQEDFTKQFRVVNTSETNVEAVKQRYPVGKKMKFYHDQSGYTFGDTWTVKGVFEHSPAGHAEIEKLIGKKSVSFSTFK